ncbi:integral membrane protein, partial [Stachybotrys elegans]
AITDCVCSNVTLQSYLSSCVQTSCNWADQIAAGTLQATLCQAYPKESRSLDVQLAAILCTAFLMPIVLARFYSRWSVLGKLVMDDYMTLVALLAHLAAAGIEIASAHKGFGKHYWHVNPESGTLLLQLFWIVQMLYIIILTFTKLAILFFLGRVFVTAGFRLAVRLFATFLGSTCIVFVLVVAFQCSPVSAVWDRYLEGNDRKCLNVTVASYALAALNILQDVLLLLLPIPWVMRLQLDLRKRIGVIVAFGLGSFACITSMIRAQHLVKFSKTLDSTWDNVDVVIWSIIEIFTALLCGSLPVIWPLLRSFMGPINSWISNVSTIPASRKTDTITSYRLRQYPKDFTELDGSDHV